ncbi:hypothetical protein GCM10010409_34190 [Mycolicibacterium diernhoferi]
MPFGNAVIEQSFRYAWIAGLDYGGAVTKSVKNEACFTIGPLVTYQKHVDVGFEDKETFDSSARLFA